MKMIRRILLTASFLFMICSVNGQNMDYSIDVNPIGIDTLNYIPIQNAKIVSVTGVNYTISEENTPDFFTLNNSGDIAEVNLYGKVIRITIPLHFPHSRINIYCDSLIFEKNEFTDIYGSINNTPLKHFQNRAHQYQDGQRGLDAKPIIITARFILKTFEGRSGEQIISNGGRGQDAGYGRNGKQGKSYPVISCSCSGCEGGASTADASSGKPTMHYKNIVYTDACGKRGTRAWPEDGEDAVAGGKPGEGGNGGDLYFNNYYVFQDHLRNHQDLSNVFFSIEKGIPGLPAKFTSYTGGLPGQPELARMWLKTRRGSKLVEHKSKKGSDEENQLALHNAREGHIYYYARLSSESNTESNRIFFWMHPEYLRVEYLDVMNSMKMKEYKSFEAKMEQLRTKVLFHMRINDTEWNTYTHDSNSTFPEDEFDLVKGKDFVYLSQREFNDLKSLFVKLNKLKYDYDTGLDYYGKPLNWAPMLSFEYNYANFNNEVEIALNEIYLAEWIISEKTSLENKLIGLVELAKIQANQINSSKLIITEALDEIPELQEKTNKLKHKTDLIFLQLKEIEKELKELAETTVDERNRKAKMYKLLNTASTLLKASPVGQPYTAIVGIGIDIINEFDFSEDGWNGFDSFSSIYQDMSEVEWKEHTKTWSDYKEEYKNLDKIESLKKVYSEFYKPLENDISMLIELFSGTKMKDSDMQKELDKLKAESNTFKRLAIDIEALTKERAELIKEIENLISSIYENFNQIVFRDNLLGNLTHSISKKQFVLSRSNANVIEELKTNAISKLDYYSYLLVKSYEYRFLRNYPNNVYNNEIYNSIRDIVKENNHSQMITLEQAELLKDVYLINLRKLSSQIITDYNSGQFTLNTRKYIPLTSEQIDDLNKYGKTSLNLSNSPYFDLTQEENIRLSDINVIIDSASFAIEPEVIEFGEIDVFITHSGISKISRNSTTRFFSHYSPETQSKYTWGARYSIHQNRTNQVDVSPSDYSLLNSLLGDFVSSNYMNIFSRPSVLSEFQIEINKNIIGLDDFRVKNLTLELIYDFE